ncbi:hypothetical protein BJ875DRAFT_141408 [Amylocarpus encephaloides]|uniref:CCZ1/INTU/HSP4 first Longin domain-containing protein n=1 Tax=Amylocarpus encephaloides TaxID=45428 RepID=A0A9P8C8M4_9HELO|nr:hypothetical protein BJ875DRAFT_141408 [Amylocarpus encephaloides]
MASPVEPQKAIPAQLGFLAIYNPSLGATDDTLANQIVYYSSLDKQHRKPRQPSKGDSKKDVEDAAREQDNDRLRRVGLAQGMVEFGRSFSDGQSVDTIETEKSRVILHELESGWWILASIDLTMLPKSVKGPPTLGKSAEFIETVEYSSREVKPAVLLLGDLLRAHSTFLLHHASSMSALLVRTKRSKFIDLMRRYWDMFLSTWNVLMHGNPANSLYGGIKIAACGELGMGVGEEERGSGEREVLEGLVGRIDGLVDVMVAKFGDSPASEGIPKGENRAETHTAIPAEPWLGSGQDPRSEDGAIFLGIGALSRKSIRDITHWVEDIYRWGPAAYGVINNPTSNRRHITKAVGTNSKEFLSRESRNKSQEVYGLNYPQAQASAEPVRQNEPQTSTTSKSPAVDEPTKAQKDQDSQVVSPDVQNADTSPVSAAQQTSPRAQPSSPRQRSLMRERPSIHRAISNVSGTDGESKISSSIVKYFKFGYGTHWTLGNSYSKNTDGTSDTPIRKVSTANTIDSLDGHGTKKPASPEVSDSERPHIPDGMAGHYLVGLLGNLEGTDEVPLDHETPPTSRQNNRSRGEFNDRLLLRTLTVELEREEDARAEDDISIDLSKSENNQGSKHPSSERTAMSHGSFEGRDQNKTKKLRVLVYVRKPFIFVLMFESRTDSLAFNPLYRSLHHQLGHLVKPLIKSTTFRATRPDISQTNGTPSPIYDLIWDPRTLTVNSTIPNIPNPYQSLTQEALQFSWSRIEALSTHMQILNTYIATTKDKDRSELERTCKTSRGWWVVWTRAPEANPPTPASGPVKIPNLISEESDESAGGKDVLYPDASRNTRAFASSLRSGPAHPFLTPPVTFNPNEPKDKEIFLIRQASDYTYTPMSARFAGGSSSEVESNWVVGPGKLAQGIGVDTKRYIEWLLDLT